MPEPEQAADFEEIGPENDLADFLPVHLTNPNSINMAEPKPTQVVFTTGEQKRTSHVIFHQNTIFYHEVILSWNKWCVRWLFHFLYLSRCEMTIGQRLKSYKLQKTTNHFKMGSMSCRFLGLTLQPALFHCWRNYIDCFSNQLNTSVTLVHVMIGGHIPSRGLSIKPTDGPSGIITRKNDSLAVANKLESLRADSEVCVDDTHRGIKTMATNEFIKYSSAVKRQFSTIHFLKKYIYALCIISQF